MSVCKSSSEPLILSLALIDWMAKHTYEGNVSWRMCGEDIDVLIWFRGGDGGGGGNGRSGETSI